MNKKIISTSISILGLYLLLAGIVIPQKSPDGPVSLPAPVNGLIGVDFPDFEGLDSTVVQQLRTARDALYNETRRPETNVKNLANAYGLAGRYFHAYSIPGTAAQCYKNAAVLQPKDFRWQHLLGVVLLDQNRDYEALKAFKESTRLNPDYVPSLVIAGNTYLDLNLNGLAANAFQSAASKAPGNPAVLFGLGKTKYAEKNYVQAAAYFVKVLKKVPAANRVHYSLALAYRNLNNIEKSREHLARQGKVGIKVADPIVEDMEKLRSGTRPRLTEAKTAMDGGQFQRAAAIYNEVLKNEPDNITALVNIGAAYVQLRKVSEAITAFENVLKIQQDNINAYYNLGVIYSMTGKPFKAVSNLKALLKFQPADDVARFQLARALRNAELLDESLSEYKKVIEKNPENEAALLDTVSLLSAKGQHRELISILMTAYDQFPSRAQTAAAYAYALATTPISELRDAEYALEIATKAYAASGAIEHGLVLVLAKLETGNCAESVMLAKQLLVRAQNDRRTDLLPKIKAQIAHSESLDSCR